MTGFGLSPILEDMSTPTTTVTHTIRFDDDERVIVTTQFRGKPICARDISWEHGADNFEVRGPFVKANGEPGLAWANTTFVPRSMNDDAHALMLDVESDWNADLGVAGALS